MAAVVALLTIFALSWLSVAHAQTVSLVYTANKDNKLINCSTVRVAVRLFVVRSVMNDKVLTSYNK